MASPGIIVGALLILAGMISIEIGFSTAILEMLAGVLGANLLGLTSEGWLEFLAQFGLLGLMFYAGFETDMRTLQKHWKKSLAIGSAAFFTPFLGILITGNLIVGLTWEASLLVAIALSTTSLAIVYTILKTKGILYSEEGQLLLSAAMVVDMLSMLALVIGFEGFTWIIIAFLFLIFPAMYVLPKLGQWLFSRYGQNLVEYEVRFLLLLILSMGFFSQAVGLHAAILAYLAGLFWNELFLEDEAVIDKLKGIIFGFLAPAFFFAAGLSIKLSNISTRVVWMVPLFTAVAIGGKYVGVGIGARFSKQVKESWLFIGALFNFQLIFSIVAAILGLEHGIIDLEMYTTILSVVLTAAIAAGIGVHVIPHEY